MHAAAGRIGAYFAVLQFFFTLTWTVYVIFLPKLAVEAGLPKSAIVWILLIDQVVFTLTDWAMGVYADRTARVVGKLGRAIALITAVSCLAFLLLPFVAPGGSPTLFLALTLLWTATSSALRAPPMMLIGKYAPIPAQPWLSGLYLFGLGAAGAVAPYLTVALRDADPRLPFILCTIAVIAATGGIAWAERALASNAAPAQAAKKKPPMLLFLAGIALAGIGFQIHFSLNSAGHFLRFAKPAELEYLMPVFWIGFNVLVLPATLITKRFGAVAIMSAGAFAGALAAFAAVQAGNLTALIAAQFIAGAAWSFVLLGAFAAALTIGSTGAEGRVSGATFSMLALASVARIALVATQLNQDPVVVSMLGSAPATLWMLTGLLFAIAYWRSKRKNA